MAKEFFSSLLERTNLINPISLDSPTRVPNGFMKASYPTEQIDLAAEIRRLLVEKKFIDQEVSLEDLHLHLKPENRVPAAYNNVTAAFFETSDRFQEIYQNCLKSLHSNTLKFDFIFQETPTIRFHFPGPYQDMYLSKEGKYLGYHVDSMNNHPLEEINCWLPLTDSYGTNTLQVSSLEHGKKILSQLLEDINYNDDIFRQSGWDLFYMKMNSESEYQTFVRESCHPVPLKYGECMLFDPRCVHATAENKERHTRVSLDFRIIPVDTYNQMTREYQSQGRTRRMFTKGDVFYKQSVLEL